MATNSMVPYSNPAGKNQTSPSVLASNAGTTPHVPTATPLDPTQAAQANPLIPVSGTVPTTSGASTTPAVPQVMQTDPGLYQQLQDIYGAAGNSLYDFMQKIGGVDSKTLQDYITSLQPQFAKSEANLHSSLGAGGVSANSSVTALGEADLQSQENALIADESAKLLQSQEGLQANLLTGVLPSAEKQVADSSGWNTFAQILNAVGGVAGSVMGLGDLTGGMSGLFSKSANAATVPTSKVSFDPAVTGGGLGTLF